MFRLLLTFIIIILSFANTCFANNNIALIRWSDDDAKTRIVIETFEKPIYHVNKNDNNLEIFIKDAKLSKFDISKNLNKHPKLINNAIISKQNDGIFINLRLKNSVFIKDFVIDNENHPNFRLVIDASYDRDSTAPQNSNKPLAVELYNAKNTNNKTHHKAVKQNAVPKHIPIIVIDPGHGGKDVGATSLTNIHEKNITLKYAMALKRSLDGKKKYKVYITRSRDEFIPLSQRLSKAANLKADLFISIHADSNPDNKLKGLSVYTLSEKASDAEAASIADHENSIDLLSKVDIDEKNAEVSEVILDMIYHKKQNYAKIFAEVLIKQLSKHVKLLNRSHRYANFKVLRSKHVPSVLIELGYLSNKEETALLVNDKYKQKIVSSITLAIESFFNNYSKL